jgi:TatA/E family protein of Tat protein translocase
MRLFRLDRVLSLDVLDVPASPPPEAEQRDVDQGLFRPSDEDVRVELELSAEGRWVAEYYPCESVSDLGDGRLRAVLRTPATGWVRRLAMRLGEDGRVVSPPELAAEIRDAASAALANYAELPAVVTRPPGDLYRITGSYSPSACTKVSPVRRRVDSGCKGRLLIKRTDMANLFDSPWKVLVVAVVLIVLFGSKKLPDAARSLGKSMRILKTEVSSMHDDEPSVASPVQGPADPAAAFPQVQLTAAPAQTDQQSQIDALQQQVRDLQRAATMDAAPSAAPAAVASESGRTE